MKSLLLLTTVVLLVQNQALATSEDDYFKTMKEALTSAASKMSVSDLAELELQSACEPIGTKFDCDKFGKPSTSPPQSVHQLSPYDVDVVGALGDSVTAAMGAGACTILTDLFEYRGMSWSIGGNEDLSKVTTIPNIIKEYNPNVYGFSFKNSPITSNARFNVAKSGAKAAGMKGQAVDLVDKMKKDKNVDYENDWKLVTLWIGGNDLCAYCKDTEKHSPTAYIENIRDALDYLQNEMPRTFVNLVQILDVGLLVEVKGLECDIVHKFVCDCASKDETSQAARDYQKEIAKLVENGRYDTTDDFTVVVQPFMIGMHLPKLPGGDKPDKSYLAPDCFHFSAKGHTEGALGLWNNMVERVGSKNSSWEPGTVLKCPTKANPYFYTSKNSGQMLSSAAKSSSSDSVDASNGEQSEDASNGEQSEDGVNAAGMVTAIVMGVVAFAVLVVVAVIVLNSWRKNRRDTTEEKHPLIQIKI